MVATELRGEGVRVGAVRELDELRPGDEVGDGPDHADRAVDGGVVGMGGTRSLHVGRLPREPDRLRVERAEHPVEPAGRGARVVVEDDDRGRQTGAAFDRHPEPLVDRLPEAQGARGDPGPDLNPGTPGHLVDGLARVLAHVPVEAVDNYGERHPAPIGVLKHPAHAGGQHLGIPHGRDHDQNVMVVVVRELVRSRRLRFGHRYLSAEVARRAEICIAGLASIR